MEACVFAQHQSCQNKKDEKYCKCSHVYTLLAGILLRNIYPQLSHIDYWIRPILYMIIIIFVAIHPHDFVVKIICYMTLLSEFISIIIYLSHLSTRTASLWSSYFFNTPKNKTISHTHIIHCGREIDGTVGCGHPAKSHLKVASKGRQTARSWPRLCKENRPEGACLKG
jgi:hypothetical protein